jgi:hypothetical protein
MEQQYILPIIAIFNRNRQIMAARPLVIATSLFGDGVKHRGGALQCALELSTLQEQYGTLELAIYFDQTTPESTLKALRSFDFVRLISVRSDWSGVGTLGSLYRFLAFQEYQHADMIITWDLDSSFASGLFTSLIELGQTHGATFSFMRKLNPPRARLFDADCWAAWPDREATYEELSRDVIAYLAAYFMRHHDTDYGCDERALRQLVKQLFLRPKTDSRLLKIISEEFEWQGQTVDYADAQRTSMSDAQFSALEKHLVARANSCEPHRTVRLSDFGFPSLSQLGEQVSPA